MKDKVKRNHNSREVAIEERDDVVIDIVLCLEVQERLGGDSETGGVEPGAETEDSAVDVKLENKKQSIVNEELAPPVRITFVKIVVDVKDLPTDRRVNA